MKLIKRTEEQIIKVLDKLAYDTVVQLHLIEPAKPTQKGLIGDGSRKIAPGVTNTTPTDLIAPSGTLPQRSIRLVSRQHEYGGLKTVSGRDQGQVSGAK